VGPKSFLLEGLAPGVYDIYARTNSGLAGRVRGVRIRPGETVRDLAIPLSCGGRVKFRAADGPRPTPVWKPDLQPLATSYDWRIFEAEALGTIGQAALHAGAIAVPAGTFRVVVERHDRTVRKEYSIAVAAGATVVIRIP